MPSHDPVIACADATGCLKVNRFGDWLQRQYLIPLNEMARVHGLTSYLLLTSMLVFCKYVASSSPHRRAVEHRIGRSKS